MTWIWIQPVTVYAVHDKQLSEHGGLSGIRNMNVVESALSRAPNLDALGNPPPDAADLAAAYIYGLASSHGFSDANKRTAWVIGRLFLAINGVKLRFTHADAIDLMLSVAGGTCSEADIAAWLRQRIVPHSLPE